MESTSERRFWWTAIGATLLVAAVVIYLMVTRDYVQDKDNFRLEAAKLFLQFLLVGVGGALVLAYLNWRRDSAENAAEARVQRQELAAIRRAALQELIRKIGDAHRRLKVVKRQLRAVITRHDQEDDGPPARPYRVPAAAFEHAMEALLSAQISAEEVRDLIAMSVDLLREEEIARIRKALRYGARYFHDAYEDYEHCRVRRDGDHYVITPACNNLHNFLFAREPPTDLGPEDMAALQAQFDIMKHETRTLDERYGALATIEKLRCSDPRERRYRAIATECFALAADDLRQALWTTCSLDGSRGATG